MWSRVAAEEGDWRLRRVAVEKRVVDGGFGSLEESGG